MKSLQDLLACKTVLLLQGPMGGFFQRLARFLQQQGVVVLKVNFNGGDLLFYRQAPVLNYQGREGEFAFWLQRQIVRHGIDAMVCFGDCRPYHRRAKQVAQRLGVRFFVFEEGYIRPNYITLEEGGVNAHSSLLAGGTLPVLAAPLTTLPPVRRVARGAYLRMVIAAVGYYLAAGCLQGSFPHYRHHRSLSVLREGGSWLRSWLRKPYYACTERRQAQLLSRQLTGRYFLQVLQVYNDSQVQFHSGFQNMESFIQRVMASFASHAATDAHLVIKHHPFDRGYKNYARLIRLLANSHGLRGRVHYVHDLHLPTLIRYCRGVVTINSTVGLQALFHDKPCITLGRALYDLPGVTHQQGLAAFWRQPEPPLRQHYLSLRQYLLSRTQLPGSFYGADPWNG